VVLTRRLWLFVSTAFVGIGALLSAATVWRLSDSAFTSVTSNSGNVWQAGQVTLTAGSSSALFDLSSSALKPGDTGSKCITITYAGNVAATVKLYVSAAGGSLASYVQMTIVRANGSGAADCSDFSSLASPSTLATTTDLVTLNTNSGTYATGLGPWTASTTTTRTYKFTYVLNSSAPNSVQNANATATFTWESQT
jgi:hypothetical protein